MRSFVKQNAYLLTPVGHTIIYIEFSTYWYCLRFQMNFKLFFFSSTFRCRSVCHFMHIKKTTLPLSPDMLAVESILQAWKQAKCGHKNQTCHYSRQQDVLWVSSPGDSGRRLLPWGKMCNGDILIDTAPGRVILCICFSLKFGSSIHGKRAATLSGLSPCYGHVN